MLPLHWRLGKAAALLSKPDPALRAALSRRFSAVPRSGRMRGRGPGLRQGRISLDI